MFESIRELVVLLMSHILTVMLRIQMPAIKDIFVVLINVPLMQC